MAKVVAIDFETADREPDSACAVGLAIVEDGVITGADYFLIRPPRRQFEFTYIHGITWDQVHDQPPFERAWQYLRSVVKSADYLAAHNAPFDRRVLTSCCSGAGITSPRTPFVCTVKLARWAWNVRPTKLPDVCNFLEISLDHHHAGSDAFACAQIVSTAVRQGIDISLARI